MSENRKKVSDLGKRLYELRANMHLSQDDLAEKLDVTRQTISNWENNKVKIDMLKAKELCELYDIPIDYLIYEDALENNAQKPKSKSNPYIMIALILLSATIMICGIVLMLFGTDNNYSSMIIINAKTGGVLIVIIGLIMVSLIVWTFLKDKKK